MTSPTSHNLTSDEWNWLAIRYLLGELSGDEVVEFEQRLAESQSAREALARTTMVVQSLGSVPTIVSRLPSKTTSARRFIAAAAVCAATVLVGFLGFQTLKPERPVIAERATRDTSDPSRLVALWIDSADSLNGAAEIAIGDESAPIDAQAALLPPDWMLAAVEHEAGVSATTGDTFGTEDDAIERN